MKKKLLILLACLMAFSCVGCGKAEKDTVSLEDDMSQHVNLKWYIRTEEPEGFQEVMEAANEYLNEKLNVTLDLVCIQPGDYDQKMQMIMASQEDYDLVWTSSWSNNFESNITKGAYLPLNEALEKVPELKNFYNDLIWQGASVNGNIYGVPVYQVMYAQTGLTMLKNIAEKYGLDPHNIKSQEELTQAYQTVKDNEPNLIVTTSATNYFDNEVKRTGGVVGMMIENGVVKDEFELQSNYWKDMKEWNQRGFFPEDITTLTDKTSLLKAGKIFSDYQRYLPGVEAKYKISYNDDIIAAPMNDPYVNRGAITSTLTAVSIHSKHPVRALKLLALTHTDPYLLNLLCYGLEGRDYTKDPENPNRMIRNSDDYYIAEFMIGNQFLAYLAPSYDENVWDETLKMNQEAEIDPNIGFCFDQEPVLTEITNISAVRAEYGKGLQYGVGDTEATVEEFRKKAELAGYAKVKEELQAQFDEWKATVE